jgi:hypothetical protein
MKTTLLVTATLIILCLGSEAIGQTVAPTVYLSSTQEYFLKNKLSNRLLDVRGGSKTPGAQIWQYDLNYSVAQRFRMYFRGAYGSNAYIVVPRTNADLKVTLKHRLNTNVSAGVDSDVVGHLPDTILGNPEIETNGTEPNTFQVVQDRLYAIKPIFTDASPISAQPRYQIWKFVPVPNEPNTYFLESAAFTERMVLQPTGVEPGSPLVLSRFNGSEIQKWLVLPTTPAHPSGLLLLNFIWKDKSILFIKRGRIKGGLEWSDNSPNEEEFEIQVKRKEKTNFFTNYWTLGKVDANKITFNFSDSSKNGNGREHCFRVIARNRWGGATSDDVCGIPVTAPANPPPPPPPSSGVESIAVYNCHSEQKTVRVWTYDYTVNTGVWENRGTLSSSWKGTSCPADSTPLQFSITPGHSYTVKAIDCGDEPPTVADGSCHALQQTQLITGKAGGGIKTIIVNGQF